MKSVTRKFHKLARKHANKKRFNPFFKFKPVMIAPINLPKLKPLATSVFMSTRHLKILSLSE